LEGWAEASGVEGQESFRLIVGIYFDALEWDLLLKEDEEDAFGRKDKTLFLSYLELEGFEYIPSQSRA
jgi:hypothetical protein